MDRKDRARISSVTVMLDDDGDLRPYVAAAGEGGGGFFVDFGRDRVQFFGTPDQLGRLGRAMLDGAADMAEQLAANDRTRTWTGQHRERAVTCTCGAQTWNVSARCDACMDRDEAAATDLPGLATQ